MGSGKHSWLGLGRLHREGQVTGPVPLNAPLYLRDVLAERVVDWYYHTMTSSDDPESTSGKRRPHRRRSAAVAGLLDAAGANPAEALVRLAAEAEATGNLSLAVTAWKALLPYRYARPKPIESDPEGAVELARSLKEAGVLPEDDGLGGPYGERLRKAIEALERMVR